MSDIENFKELLRICDILLGPNGCPWDREQTMLSARKYVLEEVSELIEAIDLGDNEHIKEELGDLFYNAVFLSRLAEKEGRATLANAVREVTEKLIRRHPHVFGDTTVSTSEEVIHHWEAIKKKEKSSSHRKSALDGIPKNLPSLSRAAKMASSFKKQNYPKMYQFAEIENVDNEDELGEFLWNLVVQAQAKGIDAEHALRNFLARQEKSFREFESSNP
jgi:tetrapyrrole methylase family protein/MazG family protein